MLHMPLGPWHVFYGDFIFRPLIVHESTFIPFVSCSLESLFPAGDVYLVQSDCLIFWSGAEEMSGLISAIG